MVKRERSFLVALLERRTRAATQAPNLTEVLRGTLRRRYVRCGKPNCHCQKDRGHGPFLYLSVTLGVGRTEQLTIAPEDWKLARQFVRNYERLLRILKQVSGANRQLLRKRLLKDSFLGQRQAIPVARKRRRRKR